MVITTKEMISLEDKAESNGISKLILMERAGKGIAKIISDKFDKSKKILFVCYHGNNGGDGFTAARHLYETGYEVKILFLGDKKKFKDEARTNFEMMESIDQDVFIRGETDVNSYDVIVDSLLGIGVAGELKSPICGVVESINLAEAYKIAIDVPTGLDPDTGEHAGVFFYADLIITMHDLKPGSDKENTVVVDIGL